MVLENNNNKESDNTVGNNNIDLKSKFLSDLKNEISRDDKNKLSFLNKIQNGNSIDSSILEEMESFKKEKGISSVLDGSGKNIDKYSGLNLEDISLTDLKNIFKSDLIKISISRNDLKNLIINDYDISSEYYNKNILNNISEISSNELIDLKKSQEKREEFLTKILGKEKIPLSRNKANIFDKIPDLKEKVKDIKYEDREELEYILQRFDSRNKSSKFGITDSQALEDLLKLDCLDNKFKEKIVKDFLPTISFGDLKNIGISFDEKNIQLEIIKNIFSEDEIKNIGEKELISSVNWSKIYIETSKIIGTNDFLDKLINSDLSRQVVDNFVSDYNISIEKTKNNYDKEKGFDTFEGLKNVLSSEKYASKFENLENFGEGKIIKIIKKEADGKELIEYCKITKINDTDKSISYILIGDNRSGKEIVNLDNYSEAKNLEFSKFASGFEGNDKTAVFYTKKDLETKINDPLNEDIKASELFQYKEKNLENLEVIGKIGDNYQKKIDILGGEIEKKQKKIDDLESSKKEGFKKRIENLKAEKVNLEARKKYLEENIEKLENGTYNKSELLSDLNLEELVKKLDEYDSNGKGFGLEKGMFLESKIDGKESIHEIVGVSNGEVILKNPIGQTQNLKFESFFQAFKKNEAKRVPKIESLEKLLEKNSKNSEKKDIWDKYEVKNGEIHIKEVDKYSKDKESKVDYLVSENSNDIYKIEKVDGGKITFRFGNRENINDIKDEKEKKKYKKNIKLDKGGNPEKENGKIKYEGERISLNKDSETLSINEFNKIINLEKKEFTPDWQTGKIKTDENPQELNNEFRSPFSTWLFDNFLSVTEIISGGKLFGDNISEYFKKGNEVHSAKAALAMSKFLPKEVRDELIVKVERAENESMEKEIESLGKVDSKIAVKRIQGWLLNKNTPEHKKEAGMLFVLSKYGTLTGKPDLHIFKGKYLWYEAFGGKIGDEHFLEIKKESEKSGQGFSEENLLFILLKKQCKEDGYKGINRRSRLHKEYEGKWSNGIKEEVEKGYNDASGKRTAKDMVKGGNDELLTGTLPNAIGWYKKAIERGGSLEDMSEGFFLMLFSGSLYNTDQKVYAKFIKSMWDADGMPQIMARFSSTVPEMKLFNQTVVELSKKIEEKNPKYTGMSSKAEGLYKKAISNTGTEPDRLKECKKFWDEYGEVLSRSINMVNGNSDFKDKQVEFSETDKIVLEEKENGGVLEKYYNSVREYTEEGSFKQDFMNDAYGAAGIGGLNNLEIVKHYFRMDSGQSFPTKNIKTIELAWARIESDLSRLNNKKVMIDILRDVFAGFKMNHPKDSRFRDYQDASPVGDTLKKWGIYDIVETFKGYSEGDIHHKKADHILGKIANDILSGNISNSSNDYDLLNSINSTKNDVDENLKKAA